MIWQYRPWFGSAWSGSKPSGLALHMQILRQPHIHRAKFKGKNSTCIRVNTVIICNSVCISKTFFCLKHIVLCRWQQHTEVYSICLYTLQVNESHFESLLHSKYMPWKSKKPFKCNTANSRGGKDFITRTCSGIS